MIITYFRSSSYNSHEMCPMQFFGDYTLGWDGLSGKAADKGTIVHKVMEIMALCKKGKQDKQKFIKDDIVGDIPVIGYDVNELIEQVYKYYTDNLTHHDWANVDFKNCKDWTWKALQFNDGQFDPRKSTIVDAEPHFDIEITEPWAMYHYEYQPDKDKDPIELEGFLRLKGTVDLVRKVQPRVYEIVDWKSGRYRKNWATGEDYTHETFRDSPQLLLYHYAVHKMYDVDQVLVTIYYINAGGPYTICFDKSDLKRTEDMLEKKFKEIYDDRHPQRNRSWKCSKFCSQGTSTFEGTDIKPMQEFRHGEVTPYGDIMTKCEQVSFELDRSDIDEVMKKYSAPGHKVGDYNAPGEV